VALFIVGVLAIVAVIFLHISLHMRYVVLYFTAAERLHTIV
jgi:hypothetical protein